MKNQKKQKKQKNEILTRNIDLEKDSIIDEQSRLVRLSFSSEGSVTRNSFFSEPWIEVLGHTKDEVDLERLNSSAPLLYNHARGDNQNRIGVVERAWIENGRGMAEVRISRREDAEGIWQDVKDGILRNVSVAYQINERKLEQEQEDAPDIYRVTSWTPMEISLVDIPADATVGIGRSYSDNSDFITNQKDRPMNETIDKPETTDSVNIDEVRNAAMDEGAKTALSFEQKRREEIRALFEAHEDFISLRDTCLDDPSTSIDKARKLLLDDIGKSQQPVSNNSRIEIGETENDKFSRAAEDAIAFRAGIADSSKKPTELYGYTMLEMARKSLEMRGVNTARMDKRELVGRAFTHSTSDFPKLLENNARKAMLKGYEEAEEVFSRFTKTGNLSDFKEHTRVGMGVFESLDEIKEGAEYKHGTIGKKYETIKLATYGKMFSITRQAIINDDLSIFTEIPRKMGRAAARTVGDLVFSVITANPTMSDGKTLFHADHKNLANTGAAISAASVGAARTAMRKQKDGDATLNISPSLLLVPAALEDTARVLMASETDPSQANSRKPNPVRNAAEIIVDARLDSSSLTSWYLLADPNRFDTIEVGYLDGVAAPFLDSQDGWNVDGAEYKVRIDAAAAPLEYRNMYKNPGA